MGGVGVSGFWWVKLLHTLGCTGRAPTAKNYLTHDVSSTKVEKSHTSPSPMLLYTDVIQLADI